MDCYYPWRVAQRIRTDARASAWDAVSPVGQVIGTRILGTGRAVGSRVLSNADLETMVDTSDAWISERTGIKERRILEVGRSTSDLVAEAGRAACAAAHIEPSDLDCIIIATVTPDMPTPGTAVRVQQKLGAGPCAAFDLSAACAGFLYGLATGDAFVKTRQFARVLLVGVEVLSRVLDWRDRDTCVLFGDGAGAVVLGPEVQPDQRCARGIVSIHLAADGNGADSLLIPGGGSLHPTSATTVAQNLDTVKMNGKAVFGPAVQCIAASCRATLRVNTCVQTMWISWFLTRPIYASSRRWRSVARCRWKSSI
jgi:3-oxoacyl-[acyl-carrier-protein] synthase-3